MTAPACPNCGTDQSPVGVEVRGTYDGVLLWCCDVCGHYWPRFAGVDERLWSLAVEWIDRNAAGQACPQCRARWGHRMDCGRRGRAVTS